MRIERHSVKDFPFILKFDYNPELVNRCRTIKERLGSSIFCYNGDFKGWQSTLLGLQGILQEFPNVEMSEDIILEYKYWLNERERSLEELEKSKQIPIKTDLPLFNYQKIGVNFAITGKKVLIADEMGLGKSLQAIAPIQILGLESVLIICPNSIKSNWQNEIRKWIGLESIIVTDSIYPDHINIINYEKLASFSEIEKVGNKKIVTVSPELLIDWDLIICDECFPYNTKVLTDIGYLDIGEIVEKRLDLSVLSCNLLTNELEWKKIIKYHRYNLKPLIRITHENGEIVCTPNHKIYTDDGYKEAASIQQGNYLFVLRTESNGTKEREVELKVLQQGLYGEIHDAIFRNTSENKVSDYSKKGETPSGKNLRGLWGKILWEFCKCKFYGQQILRSVLFGKVENVSTREDRCTKQSNERQERVLGGEEKTRCGGADDKVESRSCIQEKDNERLLKMEKIESNIPASWRERKTYEATNNLSELNEICDRIFNCDISSPKQVQEPPHLLQGRFSKRGEESSNRGGRILTQDEKMEILRQEKNGSLKLSGVVSIEILEQRDIRESSRSDGENKSIYDIEVEDNHNYFAENILVSNSHYIKERKTIRAQAVLQLVKKPERVILLTGTPILNRPKELIPQLIAIDRMKHFGKEWDFLKRYCDAKQGYWGWDFSGSSNTDELKKKLDEFTIRRLKKEVLKDLPDKLIHSTVLDMVDPKKYNALHNESVTEIKELVVQQKLFHSNMKKLSEDEKLEVMADKVASAGSSAQAQTLVIIERLKQEAARQKLEAAQDILLDCIDSARKTILFTRHKEIAYKLYEQHEDHSVCVTGDIPAGKRQELVDKFNTDKGIIFFIATMQSAGVGFNLTSASEVKFLELGWTPAEHKQCEDRAYRIGTKNTVNVDYLILKDSIDEDIIELLNVKSEVIESISKGQLLNKLILKLN